MIIDWGFTQGGTGLSGGGLAWAGVAIAGCASESIAMLVVATAPIISKYRKINFFILKP